MPAKGNFLMSKEFSLIRKVLITGKEPALYFRTNVLPGGATNV